MKNYYQILGIDSNATFDEIKRAYRLYASKFHPDIQSGDKFFEERFKEIKEAYDVLKDPSSRLNYDAQFESGSYKTATNHEKLTDGKEDRKIYYTTKSFTLSGNYINCNGVTYDLKYFDLATIRRDDSPIYKWWVSYSLILIGLTTLSNYFGIVFLAVGISFFFAKKHFLVLVSRKGDVAILRDRKRKLEKLKSLINKVISINK